MTSSPESASTLPPTSGEQAQRRLRPSDEPTRAVPRDEGERARISAEEETNEDPGSLGQRFFRPRTLISFGVALFIVVFLFTRLDVDPGEVWSQVKRTNPWLYLLGFAIFYGSFVLRALRWEWMLARAGIDKSHGYPIPALPGMLQIFLLSWFANCIVPAKLGDMYRSYLFKQRTKASFSTTFGTILAERLIDLLVLVGMLAVSGIVVFGSRVPGQAGQTVWAGSALVGIGVVGCGALWFARDHVERLLPERLQHHFAKLHDGIFVVLRRPFAFTGISVLVWMAEGLRVLCVAWALDTQLSISTALMVALMSSLLTIIPFTPAGLGVVEGATIGVLRLVGVDDSTAVAIALLDRVIGYWSVIAVGLPLYVLHARKELDSQPTPLIAPAD
jgi:glycosyltransferase 2 family protein